MSKNLSTKNQDSTVYLNVYEFSKDKNFTSTFGLGIYHTSVEVYGKEYGFAFHGYTYSGIYSTKPKDTSDFHEPLFFKCSLDIGKTNFTPREIEKIISALGKEFRGIDYHLLKRNCNHFSQRFIKVSNLNLSIASCVHQRVPKFMNYVKILTSVDVSRRYAWINRGARYLSNVPFVDKYFSNENKIDAAKFQRNISRLIPCELLMDVLKLTLRGTSASTRRSTTRSNRVTANSTKTKSNHNLQTRSSINYQKNTAKSL